MSYIEKTLLADEKILYSTKPHCIIFYQPTMLFFSIILSLLFGLGKFILALLLFLTLYNIVTSLIGYYFSEYAITNKRVIMKVGFIHRQSLEIFLNRLEGSYVDQNIIGRILNFGTITITGIGGTKNTFYFIPKPLKFRRLVQQEIEK